MTRRGAAPLALLAVVALAGCETTQQKSAQIAKRLGDKRLVTQQTTIGDASKAIVVVRSAIVHGAGASAAVLELKNVSATTQRDVPIVITAYDASGRAVYSNDTLGTSSPAGELSALAPHASAWWVDANVLASGGIPVRVSARIGLGTRHATAPALRAGKLAVGSNFVGPFIGGTVSNASSASLSDVTVYAVALDGGHIVGAGQSLIPSIGARASGAFQVTLVGATRDAYPAATIVPER